jgi:glucose-6-phosphate isomerase
MLELTYQNILEDGIGENGFDGREFEKASTVKKIRTCINNDKKKGRLNFLEQFANDIEVKDYQYYVDAWRDMDTIIVVGKGGAIFGTKTLFKAFTHPFHNYNEKYRKGGKRLFFIDNLDPDNIIGILEGVSIQQTGFIIVSKTGDDPQTLALLGIIREKVGAASLQEHVIFITHPESGALRELALNEGYTEISLPENISQRYFILGPGTFLPLLFAGIEIKKIYTGAKRAARAYRLVNFQNPAILLACIIYEFMQKKDKKNIIFFSFQERLNYVGEWLSYLFGETVCKNGVGITTHYACGSRDIYQKLYSYLEGEQDKVSETGGN